MNLDLNNKRVFIAGSSRGIGYGIAKKLYEEGCNVALNGRNLEDLISAASGLPGAVSIEGDVSNPEIAKIIISRVESALGGLDILVCNVGSGSSVLPGEETYAEWQRVFALNLWSTTNLVEASRHLLQKSQGSIVCISSICGSEVVRGAPITYSVAKSALHAYVRGIARPLGEVGVRINAVAPGNILFPGSGWEIKMQSDPIAIQDMLKSDVPLHQFGEPIDIANVVAFLASPLAKFVTGKTFEIDGGQVRS